MFIIYGTKTFSKIMALIGPFTCESCKNAIQFQILRQAGWFTLFWIPIFPFSFKYYRVCTVCGYTEPLDKNLAKDLIARAKQSAASEFTKV